MTKLLEQAFADFPQGELESERRWAKAFEASQHELAGLALEAVADYGAGRAPMVDHQSIGEWQ